MSLATTPLDSPDFESIDDVDLTDLDLFKSGLPTDVFRALREEDPVHWTPPPSEWAATTDPGGYWAVTSYEDVVAISRDVETFSAHDGFFLNHDTDAANPVEVLRSTLTGMQPPQHTTYRALLAPPFRPTAIASLEDTIRARMAVIVDRLLDKRDADLVQDVAVPLPTEVITDFLGFSEDATEQVFRWGVDMAVIQDSDVSGGQEGGHRALRELVVYTADLAEQRRRTPTNDLLSHLANAEIHGSRLTDDQLAQFLAQLIVAGTETSRNTIAVGVKILQETGQWDLLVDDPSLIPNAVEECLRWTSSIIYMRRTATRDTELHGRSIKKGDKVVQYLAAANRDPELNDDPEKFDILRKPIRHVSFGGGGARYCVGAGLARTQIRIALEELIRRAPRLSITGDATWLRSNWVSGLWKLPITANPRS